MLSTFGTLLIYQIEVFSGYRATPNALVAFFVAMILFEL
jgi:hypothetical protein